MATFKFCQDIKQTIWSRNTFMVEANTEEESREIVKKLAETSEDVSFSDDTRVSFNETEYLFDTVEEMLPEENDGNSTMEFYAGFAPKGDNSNWIADNVTK